MSQMSIRVDWTQVIWSAGVCLCAASTRHIAIPADLDRQLVTLFAKSQMIQKHTKLWMTSAGRGRVDTIHSQDYRNIVEGLQVCLINCINLWYRR